MRMTWWDSSAQTWQWRATDHAGVRHSGTALTQAAAERDATMAEQVRAGEPDHRYHAPWRTMRWSRREQRMVPNVRPRLPRLPTPPGE